MEDQGFGDEKIVAVCLSDPFYSDVKSIHDLPSHILDEFKHFFLVYKALENKETSITTIEVEGVASDLVMLNESKVSFALRLPNPENKVVKYIWNFPEGAKDADGNVITSAMEFTTDPETGAVECPQNISFSNLGSQQVTIDAIFDLGSADERQLEQSYINVQVA